MAHCYRCKYHLTDVTPDDLEEIDFYVCEGCGSSYAKQIGQQLHDRWQMPITIPLYSLIYEQQPLNVVDSVVNQISRKKRGYIEVIIEHIKDELNTPKQKLTEIHDYAYPDEQQFREFLRLIAIGLQNRLDNPPQKQTVEQQQNTSSFWHRLKTFFRIT